MKNNRYIYTHHLCLMGPTQPVIGSSKLPVSNTHVGGGEGGNGLGSIGKSKKNHMKQPCLQKNIDANVCDNEYGQKRPHIVCENERDNLKHVLK